MKKKKINLDKLNDFMVVLKTCSENGLCLKFASDEFRDNKNIVMFAVGNWGNALQYASDRLKDDDDVVKIAKHCSSCGNKALQYASNRLKEKYGFNAIENEQVELQDVLDEMDYFQANPLQIWDDILYELRISNHIYYEPLINSRAYIKENDIFVSLNTTSPLCGRAIVFIQDVLKNENENYLIKRVVYP